MLILRFKIGLFPIGYSTDLEKPNITCVDQSRATDRGKAYAVVVWEDPVTTDNSGNIASVNCKPLSGSNFAIGNRAVTCTATDNSSNEAVCSFQVLVTGVFIFKFVSKILILQNFLC